MQELVGHANEQVSEVHSGYTDLYNLTNRKAVIDKIHYDIEIDKFKKWSWLLLQLINEAFFERDELLCLL